MSSFNFYSPKDKSYDIGDEIINFQLKNAIDGEMVSLDSYKNNKAVVLVFTCNHCPFSKKYEQRLIDMALNYDNQGIAFILINPNDPSYFPEDDEKSMKERAINKKYPFPYLVDADQSISDLFNASKTPEVFLLENKNSKFVLVYKGAIDDNVYDAEDIDAYYLKDALNQTIRGEKVRLAVVKSVGCSIKRKR